MSVSHPVTNRVQGEEKDVSGTGYNTIIPLPLQGYTLLWSELVVI
jgi:hypothetical protein